jgi:hypothetical protein
MQLEIVEETGLEIGWLGETPGGEVGVRDGDDVVAVLLHIHSGRDRIARDALDVPAQVRMRVVQLEMVGAVGEGACGGKVAEAACRGAVHLGAEGGLHVVGSENEVDEAPEPVALRGTGETLASDDDEPFERRPFRCEEDEQTLHVDQVLRLLLFHMRPVQKGHRALLECLDRLQETGSRHGPHLFKRGALIAGDESGHPPAGGALVEAGPMVQGQHEDHQSEILHEDLR